MDKLILDFAGERLEIPSGFQYERSLVQLGMKVEHNGQMFKVVDRHVLGVDIVAQEFSTLAKDAPMNNGLTLVIILEKA